MRPRVIHVPPQVMADLVALTPPGNYPEWVAEQALALFAFRSREERHDLISGYWLGAARRGVWRKLRVTERTYDLARQCKVGAWSAEQTLLAALEWYLRQRWQP